VSKRNQLSSPHSKFKVAGREGKKTGKRTHPAQVLTRVPFTLLASTHHPCRHKHREFNGLPPTRYILALCLMSIPRPSLSVSEPQGRGDLAVKQFCILFILFGSCKEDWPRAIWEDVDLLVGTKVFMARPFPLGNTYSTCSLSAATMASKALSAWRETTNFVASL